MAMLIMAASTFFTRGLTQIGTIEEAHRTLEPLLGSAASAVFAISLLASGLSSSSVGTMAGQVIMGGFLHRRTPIWLRRLRDGAAANDHHHVGTGSHPNACHEPSGAVVRPAVRHHSSRHVYEPEGSHGRPRESTWDHGRSMGSGGCRDRPESVPPIPDLRGRLDMFKNILVPLDGSALSEASLGVCRRTDRQAGLYRYTAARDRAGCARGGSSRSPLNYREGGSGLS